ncbi:hypothetical protein TNCV_2830201 [Trichonephila clavipes]|nr:hypothetical protein TNCV_2830201 [Trichonephila clavipes]
MIGLRVHSSPFDLSNSTPSSGACSISAISLLPSMNLNKSIASYLGRCKQSFQIGDRIVTNLEKIDIAKEPMRSLWNSTLRKFPLGYISDLLVQMSVNEDQNLLRVICDKT